MKASELIKRLQELIDEYGDHDVLFDDAAGALYHVYFIDYEINDIVLRGQ